MVRLPDQRLVPEGGLFGQEAGQIGKHVRSLAANIQKTLSHQPLLPRRSDNEYGRKGIPQSRATSYEPLRLYAQVEKNQLR